MASVYYGKRYWHNDIWEGWNRQWYTPTSSSTITWTGSGNRVWEYWLDSTTASTTLTIPNGRYDYGRDYSTDYSTPVWGQWLYVQAQHVEQRERTAEEIAERERRAAESQRLFEENQRRQQVARQRGHRLLVECLTEEQRTELANHNMFHVVSNRGRRFCIKMGRTHNVFLLGLDGKPLIEYCGHVRMQVPDEDNVLAQKFIIENDEDEFTSIANARRLRPDPLPQAPLAPVVPLQVTALGGRSDEAAA